MSARKRQRRLKRMVDEMFQESDHEVSPGCESSFDNDNDLDTSTQSDNHQEFEQDDPFDFREFDYVSSEDDVELGPNVPAPTFQSDLASWAGQIRLPRDSTNALLLILRKHGMEVPKDYRTLMKTPRSVEVLNRCGGTYYYFGIKHGISSALGYLTGPVTVIELSINVDGLPLEKSTNSQFWPILGSINNSEHVFVIAIFHGYAELCR